MKQGRKPLPQKILELTESRQRYNDRGEIAVDSELPECPSWVSKSGKKYWEEIAISLHNIGIIANIDSVALSLLVDALAQYIEARNKCDKEGLIEISSNGTKYQSPYAGAANKAWDRVYKIIRDFGMTPSSRVGLSMAKNNSGKKSGDFDVSDLINVG